MRVAVVDIGTNSTRLLVADVTGDGISELERRSIVTRLGEGVDASGELGSTPQQRVFDVLEGYAVAISEHGCEAQVAVMTSAVRDASNGAQFAAVVRERFGLDAMTLSGDEEAALTYAGATAARNPDDSTELLVIDIGGGSTELVTGTGGAVSFHVSTQAGVVRHTERHLHSDPPEPAELEALCADVRGVIEAAVPTAVRERAQAAVAVAGTATMCAAMDLALVPYDARAVEGHRLDVGALEARLASLAAVPLAEREKVPGLVPERAPTIVAGVALLLEVLRSFGLDAVEISDRDILWGVALRTAGLRQGSSAG